MPPIVHFDAHLGVLRFAGDEDRTTSGRRRRPISAALKATSDVIVDLSELHFADASLMIDLACSRSGCARRARMLWLSGPQPHIRTLIETVGLHRLPAVRLDGPLPGADALSARVVPCEELPMLLPLVLLFIVVPIAELAVIIQVGQAIGVLPTIAILIADSLLGAAAHALAGPRRLAPLQRGARPRAACPRARCSTARS